MELEALTKKRSTIKGQLTKLITFTDNVSAQTKPEEITVRLDKLQELTNLFNEVEFSLFHLDPTIPSETSEFDESTFTVKAKLLSIINGRRASQPAVTSGGALPDGRESFGFSSSFFPIASQVKLPNISIPKFNGQYENWQAFDDIFRKTIHDNASICSAQKFI